MWDAEAAEAEAGTAERTPVSTPLARSLSAPGYSYDVSAELAAFAVDPDLPAAAQVAMADPYLLAAEHVESAGRCPEPIGPGPVPS